MENTSVPMPDGAFISKRQRDCVVQHLTNIWKEAEARPGSLDCEGDQGDGGPVSPLA